MQHAEQPAHAEEDHDHHGADAGHEAAVAAGASDSCCLDNPCRELVETRSANGAAAYRVLAREPRRPGRELSRRRLSRVSAWLTPARVPRHRPSTGERLRNSDDGEERNGMACLVIDLPENSPGCILFSGPGVRRPASVRLGAAALYH